MSKRSTDLIVVGGGIAGMYGALCAASEADVVLLTKGPIFTSASYLAQGGVAAAVGVDDTPELHAEDTLRAGRGLSRPSAVDVLTREAPARVADLTDLGVPFDDDLGLEGGHSRRRVVHAQGAATGAVIARILAGRVLDHPRIDVREGERVVELVPAGVRTRDETIVARGTILATGGYSALWARTTNPPGSRRRRNRARSSCGSLGRRPRVRPVPPTRRRRERPPHVRGASRRGRDADRRARRAFHHSSLRATWSRGRSMLGARRSSTSVGSIGTGSRR